MFRCPTQNCTMAQYFSRSNPKPGRNVLTLLCNPSREILQEESCANAMSCLPLSLPGWHYDALPADIGWCGFLWVSGDCIKYREWDSRTPGLGNITAQCSEIFAIIPWHHSSAKYWKSWIWFRWDYTVWRLFSPDILQSIFEMSGWPLGWYSSSCAAQVIPERKQKQNITTKRTPHIVYWWFKIQI